MKTPSVYQKITDRIINALSQGKIPWEQPYKMPYNFGTGRKYNGINQIMLAFDHFDHPAYLTMAQANKMGCKIKKGAQGTPIIYWATLYKDKAGNALKNPQPGCSKSLYPKLYYVFNVTQIEELTFEKPVMDIQDSDLIQQTWQHLLDTFIQDQKIRKMDSTLTPCYAPAMDSIFMPPMKTFHTAFHYLNTLTHECVHATGHKDRLNREGVAQVNTDDIDKYSFEELVAQIGTAFIRGFVKADSSILETQDTAYINGWIETFKSDPKMIIQAASKAQGAADLITTGMTYQQLMEQDQTQCIAQEPGYVYFDGPYSDFTGEMEEFPYWIVRYEFENGSGGKGYTVNSFDKASKLAEDMSDDRKAELVQSAMRA